ncbi:MAG: PaaI family thioesterase [Myxococcales bacterium]|nr:MAG: PaaI family thioesterase [Myxococcales bacterium]
MSDSSPPHPFADTLGLSFDGSADGQSRCRVTLRPELMNPHGVVHGAVAYALADTGMGAALYTLLGPEESCATIEIKIVYLASAREGELVCETKVVRKGSRVAVLESEVFASDRLIAKALGTYSILSR